MTILTPLQITYLNEIAADIHAHQSTYNDYEDLSEAERQYLVDTLRKTYHMDI